MQIKRFTRPFRQLRGKLTLSYTLTSLVTFLLIEITVLTIAFLFIVLNVPNLALSGLKQEAPQAAPYFVHGTPDREALTAWLHIINPNVLSQGALNHSFPIFLIVVNTQGQIVASTGTLPNPSDTMLQAQLSPQNSANFRTVLNDKKGTTSAVGSEADGTLVAITPIVGSGSNVQGALVMKIDQPDRLQVFFNFLQAVLLSVVVVTTIAAIAGLIFGSLTAHGFTRRLQGLSAAADRWSRGDFSAYAHDPSEDELGQVAHQLNRMAEQLQQLLQERQKLATLEERNRLARDLHDSVKQQIFAVSMQIAATRVLLRRDVDAAEVRLHEAEKLVHQAQQELTSLIRELRPVALEGKGLVAALRELAIEWTRQTEIVANVQVEGTQVLPLIVEEAFFRIVQEALANVARHSNATLVQLIVTITDDTVTLSIVDNGRGFDVTRRECWGVGLLSMQERMKALGGDVQIESVLGQGARVVAHCHRLGVSTGSTIDTATKSS